MSFLAQIEDGEHAQTLEATLAFLDEVLDGASGDVDDDASASDFFDEILECGDSQAAAASLSQLQRYKPTTTKRARVETRTKIRQLQDQVEELQVRLQQLRARRPLDAKATLKAAATEGTLLVSLQPQRKKPCTSSGPPQTSIWLDQVVKQYNKLQKARALNQKLKGAARKQVAACKSLIAHLHKKAPLEDLDFVAKLEAESASAFSQQPIYSAVSPFETATVARRHNQLQMLYLQTDTRCYEITASNDIDSAFTGSHTRQDPQLGPVFEFKANTPVAFHFRDIGRVLWRQITMHKNDASAGDDCVEIPYVRDVLSSTSVHERPERSVTLHTPIVGDVDVKCVNTWRKFDEPNRIVFTHTSAIRVVGSDVRFFESAWVILTKVSPSPAPLSAEKTIVQMYTRFHADPSPPASVCSEEGSQQHCAALEATSNHCGHLQEFVRQSLCNRTRAHQHQIQTFLLADAGDCFNVAPLPTTCPFAALRAH